MKFLIRYAKECIIIRRICDKFEKVDGKNIWDILRLKVKNEQEEFIASNEISIIQIYIAEKSGGVALPFGIYEDKVLIGFVLIGF